MMVSSEVPPQRRGTGSRALRALMATGAAVRLRLGNTQSHTYACVGLHAEERTILRHTVDELRHVRQGWRGMADRFRAPWHLRRHPL